MNAGSNILSGMEKQFYINPAKSYKMPSDISVIKYKNYFIVIATLHANWIVLSSNESLDIFNYLRNNASIADAIGKFGATNKSLIEVITQLEAKRFCSKEVKMATSEFRNLHIYLTNNCNLSCPHCYMFSGKAHNAELTTEEILKLLEDYKLAGGERVTFSGGEPTTKKDFDAIVKFAYDLGLTIRILSNGILWSESRIKALAECIDSIQISIDGFSEESNSIVRGKGNFQVALDAIDLFVKNRVKVSIGITPPMALLKEHLEDYSNFAKKLVQKYKGKAFLIKFSQSLLPGREICPTKAFNLEYYNLIQKLNNEVSGANLKLQAFVHAIKSNIIMDNCMFGVFAIAANGDVYLCARTSELKSYANIRTTSFDEIVRFANIAEHATDISHIRPCNNCDIRYICGGGCRIEEFPQLVKRGNFDNIDYDAIPQKECSLEYKQYFYNLMVESNPYLYSSPE